MVRCSCAKAFCKSCRRRSVDTELRPGVLRKTTSSPAFRCAARKLSRTRRRRWLRSTARRRCCLPMRRPRRLQSPLLSPPFFSGFLLARASALMRKPWPLALRRAPGGACNTARKLASPDILCWRARCEVACIIAGSGVAGYAAGYAVRMAAENNRGWGRMDISGTGPVPETAQAASLWRPLARRLASTLRPATEDMRARKPCRLLRLRLLGWKVRFIGILLRLLDRHIRPVLRMPGGWDLTESYFSGIGRHRPYCWVARHSATATDEQLASSQSGGLAADSRQFMAGTRAVVKFARQYACRLWLRQPPIRPVAQLVRVPR